jgi:hypothetical protein
MSLGATSEAVPDLSFYASVACAAPGVDGHRGLPKGGHEVGPWPSQKVIGFASRSAGGPLPAESALSALSVLSPSASISTAPVHYSEATTVGPGRPEGRSGVVDAVGPCVHYYQCSTSAWLL